MASARRTSDAQAVSDAIRAKLKAEGRITGDDTGVYAAGAAPSHRGAERQQPLPEGSVVPVPPRRRPRSNPETEWRQFPPLYLPTPTPPTAAKSIQLATGDTVRVTANGQHERRETQAPHRHRTYAVTGFTEAGDIRLANGWVVGKDVLATLTMRMRARRRTPPRGQDLRHRAGERSRAATFPAAGREQLYVSLTRAKFRTTLFTDNTAALREAVDRSQAKANATDLVPLVPYRRPNKIKQRALFMAKVQQLRDKVADKVSQLTHGRDRDAQLERG